MTSKLVLVLIVLTSHCPARASTGEVGASPSWVGTYVEADLQTGGVQRAVRVYKTVDGLEADVWANGAVRRLGSIFKNESIEARFCEDWLERSLELRAAGRILIARAVRLERHPVRRAFQRDPRVGQADRSGVSLVDFEGGRYDRPAPVAPGCEVLANPSGFGPGGPSGG